jgi:8-oxo-dGTP diphosphatase
MTSRRQKSSRNPILAAGGIVTTAGRPPLVAVVQRRKDDGWVLPKGKLKSRETALAAARREVIEETGHRVSVHEFLGSVSYQSGGRPKVVQFWRMASLGDAQHEPMSDIKAVEWLPLNAAVARLSQPLEQAFLAQIGKSALARTRQHSHSGKSARITKGLSKTINKPLTAATELRKRHKQRAAAKLRLKLRMGQNGHAAGPEGPPAEAAIQSSAAAPNFIRRIFRRLQHSTPDPENGTAGHAPPRSL